MFVDEVKIEVTAGRGGNGMASYRREKYVEFGGPWGGNGGHGGSIIFQGEEGRQTLVDLRYQRHIKAKSGVNGMSKGMHGKNAEHTIVKVPLGTIVFNEDKSLMIGEITTHGQQLVVAKGGKGGRGNIALATSRNPAPGYAEKGDPGESRLMTVELKVLADVGLLGYPSVGKSTLISVLSNARPKIASYPFTTLQPNLGMVESHDRSFVLADLPGLIENAHQGHGLGIRFLRHIERCRVFVHVLDLSTDDPFQAYLNVNHELKQYDPNLLERPQIVCLNKTDQVIDDQVIIDLKNQIVDHPVVAISALEQKGLTELKETIFKTLDEHPRFVAVVDEVRQYTFEAEEDPFTITLVDGVYELTGTALRTIFERTDFSNEEAVRRFARQLRGLGVDDALREKGIKSGDTVKIFDYVFEFID
jgi:GTPase